MFLMAGNKDFSSESIWEPFWFLKNHDNNNHDKMSNHNKTAKRQIELDNFLLGSESKMFKGVTVSLD